MRCRQDTAGHTWLLSMISSRLNEALGYVSTAFDTNRDRMSMGSRAESVSDISAGSEWGRSMKLKICVHRRGEAPLCGTLWEHCLLRSCRGFNFS